MQRKYLETRRGLFRRVRRFAVVAFSSLATPFHFYKESLV
jgi:hypothetical protein